MFQQTVNQLSEIQDKLKSDMMRVYVEVDEFSPYYFDAPLNLSKGQILFLAQQQFFEFVDVQSPINLKFDRFIRFKDGVHIKARILQIIYKNMKEYSPMERPLNAEPAGFEQETCVAPPIDGTDYTLYGARIFPCSLYINQLLIHIFNPQQIENDFTQNQVQQACLIFYHKEFFTSSYLLNKLFELFNYYQPPVKHSTKDFHLCYQINQIMPLKTNILKFIKNWLIYYRDDFKEEELQILQQFYEKNQQGYFQVLLQQIMEHINVKPPILKQANFSYVLKCIDKDIGNSKQHLNQCIKFRMELPMFCLYLNKISAPKSILLSQAECIMKDEIHVTPSLKHLQFIHGQSLFDASPEALSSIFNYFLYEVYLNIHPRELIGSLYTKQETHCQCPNVILMVRRDNIINNFVASSILRAKKRSLEYEKFLQTAIQLKQMKNYDACMAVINGLNWAPVERLQLHTKLPKLLLEQDEKLKFLFGLGDNWSTIRKEINATSSDEFCIPVLNICVKDIFMVEESAPRFEDKRINLLRALMVWRGAHQYLRFQGAQFNIMQFNEQLYSELSNYILLKDDDLYQLSYKIKPV